MTEPSKEMDSVELYTGGATEKETIEIYKKEISRYNVIQLKEMLKNIDAEKFPIRHQAIKEELDRQLSQSDAPRLKEKKEETKKEKPIETKKEKPIQEETEEQKKERLDHQALKTINFYFGSILIVLLASIYILLMVLSDLPGKQIIKNLIELGK